MNSVLTQISKFEYSDESKKLLASCDYNKMKDVLKKSGTIEYKKDLTKPMYKMFQLVANDATEEEKNTFILQESINNKIHLFRRIESLIYEISRYYYNHFTYEASQKFDKLFKNDLILDDLLNTIENIDSLENYGSISNIEDRESILSIKNQVIDCFIEDGKSEISAFEDGYGFEEPEEDDFDDEDEDEYNEELENYNSTLNSVQDIIKSSRLLN